MAIRGWSFASCSSNNNLVLKNSLSFCFMFSVGKSSLFSFSVSKRTRLNLVVMLLSEPVPSKRRASTSDIHLTVKVALLRS